MSLKKRPTPAGRAGRSDNGISAPFGISPGYKRGKAVHHGQDYYWLIADPAGSRKVFATAEGTVTKIEYTTSMGQCVTIDHGGFETRSCHMPKNSAAVKVGQAVNPDTYLGPMGNAGTEAGGQYHLHFEVWLNGTRVDPEPYFKPDPAPAPEPPKTEPTPPKTEPTPPKTEKEPKVPTTPPSVTIPSTPEIILPNAARSILYVTNWAVGVSLTAVIAGWLATGAPAPTWLLVAIAVYGSVSSSVSLIAKANTPK